jgi:large subunit ribosomal protein L10
LAISRTKKEELVEEYRELVEGSRGLILTGYSGLTVRETEELRAQIRKVGGEFHIVKNSLIALAMEKAGVTPPEGAFDGTTAIGFAEMDIPGVAKAMVDLAKDAGVLQIKGGVVEGGVYGPDQIERLAELPSLPALRAQLLGLLKAPSRGVVNSLADSVRRVVNVVKAYSDTEGAEASA